MGGTVNLYGGEISGNRIANSNGGKLYGGGIAFVGGTFNMYGGAVKKNSASYYGGGVYLENAVFYLYDGEISGNTTATKGAGVYLAGNSTFVMSGGRIAENVTGSDGYGGGVYLSNYNSGTGSATFTMTGGEISGNKTQTGEFYNQSGGAAGVYVGNYDTFVMTGGSITGNVSSYNGYYFSKPFGAVMSFGTFTVSGDAVISGNLLENTKNETDPTYTESDLHLRNEYQTRTFNVGELTEGARIGIYSEKAPTDEESILAVLGFAANNPGKAISDFFYSTQGYRMDVDESGNILLYPHVHEMTLVPEVPAGCDGTYGKSDYYHCETCGKNYEDEDGTTEITNLENWGNTEALGHDYAFVVTAPTCTEQGYTTYTCNRCGDSYVDNYTEALGHDWGEWTITKEVTEEDGEETRVCRRDPSHVETRAIPAPTEAMTKPEKSNAGVIVAVVIAVVVLAGGGAAAFVILKKKKAN